MEILSIKSSAFYGYTATDSNATITGTFTTSTLPVIEVDGMYVTTNVLSTVTTYTETTLTEYTSYTSSVSTTETTSSYSKGQYKKLSVIYATQPSKTISYYNGGTNTYSLFSNYKTVYWSETGNYTISTVGITTTMYVNGTEVSLDTGSAVKSTASGETTGCVMSNESYDDYNIHSINASGRTVSRSTFTNLSCTRTEVIYGAVNTTKNYFTGSIFSLWSAVDVTEIGRRGYNNVTTVRFAEAAAGITSGWFIIDGENSSTITSASMSDVDTSDYGTDSFRSSRGFTTISSYD